MISHVILFAFCILFYFYFLFFWEEQKDKHHISLLFDKKGNAFQIYLFLVVFVSQSKNTITVIQTTTF